MPKNLKKSVFWGKEPFFNGQPPKTIPPLDAEFNSAPNSNGFRPNSGIIANRARKYLGDDPQKPVFGVKVIFFDGQPPSKVPPFDAEFNSAPNSSRFRPNSGNIANRARKYLGDDPQKPVFGVKVIFFDGQPPPKVPPFDAEFNSAPNSSGFRPNSGDIANRARKYLGDDPQKPVFGVKVIFFDGQPPSKVPPFDAEFNSAPNSSRFRPNSVI